MAEVLEKTGKTVEDAYRAALAELNVSEDRVTYEVLEEPSKGFFGLIGTKPAKVRITVKELTPLEKATKFLEEIFTAMQLEVRLEREDKEDCSVYNLIGENLGILIGKHGQTLDALQYLANLAANRGLSEEKVRIVIDVENYRSRREETLRRLALRLADKARHTGEKIMLGPMNRHERKIIHMALQDNRRVTTFSAGDEPRRYVVIAPKRRRSRKRDYERFDEE